MTCSHGIRRLILTLSRLAVVLLAAVLVAVALLRYGDVLTDKDGLPLVYDSESIGRYWDKRPAEVRAATHVLWRHRLDTLVPTFSGVLKELNIKNSYSNLTDNSSMSSPPLRVDPLVLLPREEMIQRAL